MQILPKETLVKVNFRCKQENTDILQGGHCLLPISVGRNYHEGDKFIATMDLINQTFASCTVMLCDTLQRHTLQIQHMNLSDDDAYRRSLELGDNWLFRNKSMYQYLKIPLKFYRWDHWLNHPKFREYKKRIKKLYDTNLEYRIQLETTATKFVERQKYLGTETEHQKRAYKIAMKYLLEECPVIVPLWQNEVKSEFIVYPKARTPAMDATYKHFCTNRKNAELTEVTIKFSKRRKPKPLTFSYTDKLDLLSLT